MKFPPSLLDDIRARLPVSAVVGKRVQLKKSGREWKGLSPFGSEKTPSFFVNDQKGSFFDFSSGKNGDIFKFVMETEGLSFPEAVERLAAEAGVALPVFSAEAEEREERRKGLHEVMELAADFFEAQLKAERGGPARRYLAGRGLEGEARQRFRIGYAPNERFALRDHLAGKGVKAEDMAETGMLIAGEDIAVPYDRFRDRVMFPICDTKGRVIAFGGRAMSADQPAKYLNSPETPLFHKGRMLFNHHNARKAAHEAGQVIAVEGYVDVIAMTLAGFAETVAPLGTAMTEDQLTHLWRMADEPIICLDGDKAGRKAAYRAIDLALPVLEPGKSLRFAALPEGQDPDDLARSGGKAAVAEVLASARPLVDMLWQREVEAGPLDTPERRAALERRLKDALAVIKDEPTRRHYRQEIDQRLTQAFAPRQQAGRGGQNGMRAGQPGQRRAGAFGQGYAPGGFRGQRQPSMRDPVIPSAGFAHSRLMLRSASFQGRESPREAFILLALAAHSALLHEFADELAELPLIGQPAERARQAILDALTETGFDAERFGQRRAQPAMQQAFGALEAVLSPGDGPHLAPDADPHAVSGAIRQAFSLHQRAYTLHSELKAAERALAEDATEANFAWIKDVKARLEHVGDIKANIDD